MRAFATAFGCTEATRILDVGGTPGIWETLPVRPRVTFANMPRAREAFQPGFDRVAADGRALPFPGGAFDIVFSNSVIEHLGTAENQERFAREIRRVGKAYWVQTPNRYFWLETHLLTPFVHWLPRAWSARIVPRFTIWEWIARPRPDEKEFYLGHFLKDVRLLGARDMRKLFPEAAIRKERFFGLTKSIVAAYRAGGV
jgi:SAM-dependent methyltransferase